MKEQTIRKCLFCGTVAPDNLKTSEMSYRNAFQGGHYGWYSNALYDYPNSRFFLCPEHTSSITEAWGIIKAQAKETK